MLKLGARIPEVLKFDEMCPKLKPQDLKNLKKWAETHTQRT
jgi:hypothetical protein